MKFKKVHWCLLFVVVVLVILMLYLSKSKSRYDKKNTKGVVLINNATYMQRGKKTPFQMTILYHVSEEPPPPPPQPMASKNNLDYGVWKEVPGTGYVPITLNEGKTLYIRNARGNFTLELPYNTIIHDNELVITKPSDGSTFDHAFSPSTTGTFTIKGKFIPIPPMTTTPPTVASSDNVTITTTKRMSPTTKRMSPVITFPKTFPRLYLSSE